MEASKKKLDKKNRLEEAACKLFTEKGVSHTTVDEIARAADVAKGTFYLYFNDKKDLLSNIVIKRSITLLEQAIEAARIQNTDDFVDEIILITNYIITFFKQNKELLTLIEKNLSWSLIHQKINQEENGNFQILIDYWINHPYMSSYSMSRSYHIMFIIIELVGTICYTSIIENQPDTIDNLKQDLFFAIRQILRK
ncbi:TetR/AcrR family transcriptional regulator [Sinanaerobacter sp. ZZT-01]|uniref:TetR/AcrR family transcriptional regulator n=1 Tax=Sinanaerobacter sp. ZZT-01 TaxID=3111540 RepID=UPI002D774512|nr:TetR/AcrR family transcriptional regulator [Sinanaerobacter sp. ZZT-01]WRR94655.1 TetR/AcrR family transcriptional regulator [Sinanaerobacter sp. ZZT-01]